MSRRVSEQVAIAQKLYSRDGQKYTLSESYLSAFCKKLKMRSIGVPSKILASTSGKICRHGAVFTENIYPSTSFGGITSNFVFGVFSGTE